MERKEVEEVEEKNAGIAAFFDLDGTLLPWPSLEKRFFRVLRYRKRIGIANYFWWFAEAMRLTPRGTNQILHANKMYLRGVQAEGESCRTEFRDGFDARSEAGRNSEARRQVPMLVPHFFREAVERVAWHAEHGHAIVIVSGTLECLAERARREMESELDARRLDCGIRVCATRLEEEEERWTGRIVGEAMFGQAKARAVACIAAGLELNLEKCFAYGDTANDRWMLEAVGKPVAVNPSSDLERIAATNAWPILRWGEGKVSARRALCTGETPNGANGWNARNAVEMPRTGQTCREAQEEERCGI